MEHRISPNSVHSSQGLMFLMLKKVNLQALTNKQNAKILSSLQHLSKLYCIDLSHNPLGNECSDILVVIIKLIESLHTLKIGICQLGKEGVSKICKQLETNSSLRKIGNIITLYLSYSTISDDGCHHICEMLSRNNSLLSLSIYHYRS